MRHGLTYDYDKAIPLTYEQDHRRGQTRTSFLIERLLILQTLQRPPKLRAGPHECVRAQGVSLASVPLSFSSRKITGMAHGALVQAASLSAPRK